MALRRSQVGGRFFYERGTLCSFSKMRCKDLVYRGTSLIRKCTLLGSYCKLMPRVIGGAYGGGRFLMGKVPL